MWCTAIIAIFAAVTFKLQQIKDNAVLILFVSRCIQIGPAVSSIQPFHFCGPIKARILGETKKARILGETKIPETDGLCSEPFASALCSEPFALSSSKIENGTAQHSTAQYSRAQQSSCLHLLLLFDSFSRYGVEQS